MALPRPSPRAALLALAAFLAGYLAFQLLTGDRLPALDLAALESARGRWRSARIASYRMTIQMEGRDLGRSVYRIEVRPGSAPRVLRDGEETTGDPAAFTVEGLLALLERELQLAENPQAAFGAEEGYHAYLKARFDRALGVPLRYRRVVGGGAGKWIEWRVTSFETG